MSATASSQGFVSLGEAAADRWPSFLPTIEDDSIVDEIWIEPIETTAEAGDVSLRTRVLFDRELVLAIPGLDAVGLVVAAGAKGMVVPLFIRVVPEVRAQFE